MAIDISNKEEKQIALTGAEIEETLLQAHLNKAAIAKISGLQSNATKIDANTLKTFDKVVKKVNSNPIDGNLSSSTNGYCFAVNYNGEEFNAVKTFLRVKTTANVRCTVYKYSTLANNVYIDHVATGTISVAPNERYVTIPLNKVLNSTLLTEDKIYIGIRTDDTVGVRLASCNVSIDDYIDGADEYYCTTALLKDSTVYKTKWLRASSSLKSYYIPYVELVYTSKEDVYANKHEQDFINAYDWIEKRELEIVNYPTFVNVGGLEAHIYFKNFQMSDEDYNCAYDCYDLGLARAAGTRVGKAQKDRFTKLDKTLVLPDGSYPAQIEWFKESIEKPVLATRFNHITVPSTAGSGKTVNLICIGESTTANGYYVDRLNEIAATDVMNLNTFGSAKTGSANHEGYGGKTMTWFATDAASPFVINGVLDFNQYLINKGFTAPDHISIQLGINAMLETRYNYTLDSRIQTEIDSYDALIANIHSTHPTIKIIINTCMLPNQDQNAFGQFYETWFNKNRYKRNVQIYNARLLSEYLDREAENIYVNCGMTLQLDCKNGYNSTTELITEHGTATNSVGVDGSGVHPSQGGCKMMGDALWAFLKYLNK